MSDVHGRTSSASANLSVADLHNGNLHVFVTVVLALVLANEGGRELLSALQPDSWREPLPSMASTRSCLAMQTSSPLPTCVLHFLRPYRIFELPLGHLPSPRMGIVTRRPRSEKPPPHATEQGDHFDHFLSLQFRSQEPVLHAFDSWAVLHAFDSGISKQQLRANNFRPATP